MQTINSNVIPHAKNNINYKVTYNVNVIADVSVVDDLTKIGKDDWAYAIVDNISVVTEQGLGAIGLAYGTGQGKVAMGEVEFYKKVTKEGRNLMFHEILHLLGAEDTYDEDGGLPGTAVPNNAMYSCTNTEKFLTDGQIVKEIWSSIIGNVGTVFSDLIKKGKYSQPINPKGNEHTKEQLKNFIQKNGSAEKL